MKRGLFSFIVVCLLFPFIVSAQRPDTSGSAVLFRKLMSGINPTHVDWVKTSAKKVNEKDILQTERGVKNRAEQYAISGALKGADIDALAFLVMMQAAKDAQKDLAKIMAAIKEINNKKTRMSGALAKLNEKKPKISRTQYNHYKELLTEEDEDEGRKEEEHNDKEHRVKTHPQLKTAPTKAELDSLKEDLIYELEAMVGRGEAESFELQQAKERRDKYLSILSSQMKILRGRSTAKIIKSLK